MASSNDDTDVPIKYESPYPSDSVPIYSPQSPTLKRQRSEEAGDLGEKRQRVDSVQHTWENDDFAALLAQATADTTKQLEQTPHFEQAAQAEPDMGIRLLEAPRSEGHRSGFMVDPHLYIRILSLPILESLSTQILSTLAQGPYAETIRIVTEPDSELGQAYTTLKSLFDQTKKIYSQQAPFLSADELNIREPEHRATIRTTNLATFVSSVFGGQDVGFYELNDHFIETFTPDGVPLASEPGQLFLNLKTQMYLSAVSQDEQERTKEDILEDLFPVNFEDLLAGRHLNTELSESERELVRASQERRESLMNERHDVESIQVLSEKHSWEDFLRSLSAHLNKAYEPLIAPYMKRHALTAPPTPVRATNYSNAYNQQNGNHTINSIEDDISAEAERAAQAALKSIGFGQYQQPQNDVSSQQHQQQPTQQQRFQPPAQNGSYQSQYARSNIPYPSQTAPTQVLYEQARQAAVAKANPGNARRPGLPSQRRPWSTEEENALMAGLDQVKGPHWSHILQLYGPGGSISEILKDRNQVQLKDKARNLKLFFLKSNIEVPYYLQTVTGDLKTRAPSQAARKVAEERARLASDEDRNHFRGIMALASSIRDQSQSNGQNGNQIAASSPGNQSRDSQDGPEEFQVTEPEREQISPTPQAPSEDEQLRQTLLAATNGDSSSHDGLQGNKL